MKTHISLSLAGALILCSIGYAADKSYSPPRAADGHPDLTGVWSNGSVTGLTRPPGVAKLVVDRTEAGKIAKANPLQRLIDADDGPSNLKESILDDKNSDRGYNAFWIDPGNFLANVKGEFRTSWIVEPANGQLPLTDAAKKRVAADRAERREKLWQGPEALPLPERCLIGFSGAGGPGMLNTMYNNNYFISQSPGSVLIEAEMVHDVRSIPLYKDKATAQASHRPAALQLWLGDSVGWWEGDTLVVEVTNLNPTQGRAGPLYLSPTGKVTERFTRVSPTQIFYAFEVDDPVNYTQKWRAEESLNARKEAMYEYACHEGNYAMEGILRGARNQEAHGIKPTEGPGIFGTPIPDKAKPAGGGGL